MSRANEARATGFGSNIPKAPVDLASVRMVRPQPEPVIGPVESGIPLPPKLGKQHSAPAQAIQELQPGQSRLFQNIAVKRLYGYAKVAKQKGFGNEYAVRLDLENDGARVWRLA
jgi:hypothetical protein